MDAIFQRKPTIELRGADQAAVLVDPAEQIYLAVNRVGSRIWGLLESPKNLSDLVEILTREFAVDEAVCRRETETFLRQLVAKKMAMTQSGAADRR